MKKYILILGLVMMLFVQNIACAGAIEELNQLYTEQRYEVVVSKASELLEKEPDHLEYNLLKGRALADLIQFEAAIPFLKKANVRDPEKLWVKAWALNYLGRCYYKVGNFEASKQSLAECIEMNATKNLTNASSYYYHVFGYDPFYQDWIRYESEHFVFHFQKPSEIKNISTYVEKGEEAFYKINTFFNSKLSKKIDYYVYNSNEDMKKIFGFTNSFAVPWFCIVHDRCFQPLGHEMTHIISFHYGTQSIMNKFINEGIAVYFDQTNLDQLELCTVSALNIGIKEIKVKELWNDWNLYPKNVSYSLAGAFVRYLIEQEGEVKFKQLISKQSYENAKQVYGDRIDTLISDFEHLFKNKVIESEVSVNSVTVCNAYWQGNPYLENITAGKPNSVLLEIEFSAVSSLSKKKQFFEKVDSEFELVAKGKPTIRAIGYSAGKYQVGNHSFWGFWIRIQDEDFAKIEKGVSYQVVSKNSNQEYYWVLDKQIIVTIL